jgi:hypothetical protein
MRHTTFRFALAPTSGQAAVLARHAGASRFAYNQSLRLVMDALAARQTDPSATVPWSGFDLINAFNAWKRGERAGRRFAVASDGTMTKQVTGLPWRHQVCAQVFEEAAVDLGRALPHMQKVETDRLAFRSPSGRVGAATASVCATRRTGTVMTSSALGKAIPDRSPCRRLGSSACTTTQGDCAGCCGR